MEELVKQDVVFFREKVLHRSFFQSWQIRSVSLELRK